MIEVFANDEFLSKPRILDDVRVLDFSHMLAGPYCTRILRDFGAEVIKIEQPAGERTRTQGIHYWWLSNCGKKSISLDLNHPKAIQIVKELVRVCDVAVENFKPRTMSGYGIDYLELKKANPKLIMCSISGYGQYGPYAVRPATANVAHALSGQMWSAAQALGTEVEPVGPGFNLGDTRGKTGVGQYNDIAMADSCLR